MDLKHVNNMVALAKQHGFTVTSTTGGQHNAGSLHGKGLAIDVRTRDKTPAQINKFIAVVKQSGYQVRDERVRPAGQKVWSGPHLHIQVPTILRKAAAAVKNNPVGAGAAGLLVFFCSLM